MELIPIKTKIIKRTDTIEDILEEYICLEEKDIIVISSKIISVLQNRIAKLNNIYISDKAYKYAKRSELDAHFCELIIKESDEIINIVKKAILTIKHNILIANAGIDLSNSLKGEAILWPLPDSAKLIYNILQKKFNTKNFGVIINDSKCMPLRLGTVGFAIDYYGFKGINNLIGKKDIYGNTMRITQNNIADMLASVANYLMGDTSECIPFVIIKSANVVFTKKSDKKNTIIDKNKCIFSTLYNI